LQAGLRGEFLACQGAWIACDEPRRPCLAADSRLIGGARKEVRGEPVGLMENPRFAGQRLVALRAPGLARAAREVNAAVIGAFTYEAAV